MRTPLTPFEAYEVDVGEGQRWAGHPTQPHGWFSLTHIAYRVAMLPLERREWFVATLPESVLPDASRRPTHICHDCPPPSHPLAIVAEQFRVAAEDMERDGCFEMAYTTVSSAARIAAPHDAAGMLSASNHLARITRQLGETRAAEELYESVLTDARHRGFPTVAGYALTGLGNLAVMRGNRPAQLHFYEQALAVAPKGTALEQAARWGLMNHALAVDSLADALVHGWRAFDLSQTDEERAGILSNLASVAYRARFVDAAVSGFEQSLAMAKPARLWLSVASAAAPVAGQAGRAALLARLEAEGRALLSAAGPFESSQWLLGLAQGWAATAEWSAAERCAREARALAQLHEFHEVVYRLDEVLSQVESQSVQLGAGEGDLSTLPPAARRGLARLGAAAR